MSGACKASYCKFKIGYITVEFRGGPIHHTATCRQTCIYLMQWLVGSFLLVDVRFAEDRNSSHCNACKLQICNRCSLCVLSGMHSIFSRPPPTNVHVTKTQCTVHSTTKRENSCLCYKIRLAPNVHPLSLTHFCEYADIPLQWRGMWKE